MKKIKDYKVGQSVSADLRLNRSWVTYSEGNDGEQNYYRDVFSQINGSLIYSYGETCIIESIDKSDRTITLSNNDIDDNDYPCMFKISIAQFEEDFI